MSKDVQQATDDPVLRHDHHGGVTLTLNRPHSKNAIDWSMLDALKRQLDKIEGNTRPARFLMVTGEGGAFCSGADLKMRASMSAEERFRHSRAISTVLSRVAALPMPTVAVVDGPAMGGGCELSLACDLRVATVRALFGVPETKLGTFPGAGGTQRLARLVGTSRAKEMVFLALPIDAPQALRIGLVNEVVATAEIEQRVEMLAQILGMGAPLAMAASKRVIDEGADGRLASGLELESQVIQPLFASKDYEEGLRAFAERREPRFTGE